MAKPIVKPLSIEGTTPEQRANILEHASKLRQFEIGLFWQRSLFFWGFLAAAFVAYAELHNDKSNDLRVAVACFGFVCSVAWTLQNRGSKYWQDAWEKKVEAVEMEVLGCKLFSNIEPRLKRGWWGARRYSVSGLTIMLSDFSILVWAGLVFAAIPNLNFPRFMSIPILLPVGSIIYAIAMLWFSRGDDLPSE